MSYFPTYNLNNFKWVVDEQMGTKARDWYEVTIDVPQISDPKIRHWYYTTDRVPDLESDTRWLFKVPSRFPGEVWAERIAYEIGVLMQLPIARVELARHRSGTHEYSGTICLNFADYRDGLSLEHGNELMEAQSYSSDYNTDKEGQLGLDAIYDYFREHAIRAPRRTPDGSRDAAFYFTGYLVLDALIGNVDRHHQNWGVVRTKDGETHLAPTFDHGACLARELGSKKRDNYLANQQVSDYADNKKGAAKIAPPGDHDRTVPFKLLEFLPDLDQAIPLCFWLDRALKIDDEALTQLFERLPQGLASAGAQRFALEYTSFTRTQLADLRGRICP